MRVRVLLQITGDDGAAGDLMEVAAFEKRTERPEDLGLSIADGKALMAAIQQRVVNAQVTLARDLPAAPFASQMRQPPRRCRRCRHRR